MSTFGNFRRKHGRVSAQNSRSLPSRPDISKRPRVVFMGAAKVGKSAIISRFMSGDYPEMYVETIDEIHRVHYQERARKISAELLDTAGAHSFPAMRRLSIATGDVFVLVYAVDDRESFEEVKRLREEILEERTAADSPSSGQAPVIVVVGNKTDLAPGRSEVWRVVADATASVDWNAGYVETSAREDTNIPEVFREVLRQARLESGESKEEKPRSSSLRSSPSSRSSLFARSPARLSLRRSRQSSSNSKKAERNGTCTVS